jgi:filamentous hemagglutinin family protein
MESLMKSVERSVGRGGRGFGGWAKRVLQGAVVVAVGMSVPSVWAAGNPAVQVTGVAAGTAAVSRAGAVTTVRTGSERTIINYSRLSVPSGETLQFVQPSATSRVLNRIAGTEPTKIDGALLSNGRVYLVNPAGVMFGQGAVINVGGLFAAAGHLRDEDFLAGNNLFTGNVGTVRNDGLIRAGEVHLVGQNVANFGSIVTTGEAGIVTMTAGKEVFIGEAGSPTGSTSVLVKVSSDKAAEQAGTAVTNSGKIDAGKGQLHLGAGDVYAAGIFNDGSLKGRAITLRGGANTTVNRGTIDARSAEGKGGEVKLLGEKVGVFAGTVDASGAAGGGTVLVGGDVQGGGGVPVSNKVVIADGATVRADALVSGDGGKVVVFASGAALVGGTVSVLNGPGGVGGFVETSGLGALTVAHAPLIGDGGTWLLDPHNIVISGATTTATVTGSFTANEDDTTIKASDIATALNTGNVTIVSAAGGGQAGTITWQAGADFTYNNFAGGGTQTRTLTLNAASTITMAGNISKTGGGGDRLNFVFSSTGGDVVVSGTLGTNGGTVTSGGTGFTVTGSITTEGGLINLNHTGAVAINGTLDAGTGNIAITAPSISQTTGMVASTLTVAAAGTVNLPVANNVATFLATNSANGAGVTFVGGSDLAVGRVNAALASTNGGALVLQSGGVFTVNGGATGGLTTGAGNVRLIANDMTISGAISSTGTVWLEPLNDATAIQAGVTGAGTALKLSNAELQQIGSGAILKIGSGTQAGNITIKNLNLLGAGPANISVDANAGNVILDDNGSGPALAVSGNIVLNGAAITAANAANNHAEVAVGSDASFITMTAANIGTGTNPIEIGKFNGTTETGYDGTIVASVSGGMFLKGIGNLVVGTVSAGGVLNLKANGSILGAGDVNGSTVSLLAGTGGVGTAAVPLGVALAAGPVAVTTGGAGAAGDVFLTQGGNVPPLTVTTAAGSAQTVTVSGTTTLTVGQDVTLSAGDSLVLRALAGDLTFGSPRTLAADTVILWAGNGASTAVVDFSETVPTVHNHDGTTGATALTIRQDGAITDAFLTAASFDKGAPTTYTLRSDTGAVAVATGANVAGTNLLLNAASGGGVTVTGPVSVLSLTTAGGGASAISGNVTTTGTDVTIGGNLELTGNISSARDVTINGTLLFKQNTTLSGRDLVVAGDVSSEAGQYWTLTSNFTRNQLFLGNIGTGLNAQPGAIDFGTAVGTVTLGSGSGAVSVLTKENGAADGHIAFGGALVLNGNLTVDASASAGADVTFGGTVDAAGGNAFTLAVNAPGMTQFHGNVGGSGALGGVTTDAAGSTRLGGGGAFAMTVAGGSITLNDDVVLVQNTTLNAAGANGDVLFAKSVASTSGQFRTLAVNAAGVTTFAGIVGDNLGGALGALTTDAAGSLVLGSGGAFGLTVQDGITLNEPTRLNGDATFTSANGGAITLGGLLSSGVGGPFAVTVNTSGTTWFKGGASLVNPLSAITTDAGGTTQFGQGGGGAVTFQTAGTQTYNDAVVLTGDATFRSPAITFAGAAPAIDAGSNTLRLIGNNITFSGPVQGIGGNLVLEPYLSSDAIVIGSTGVAANTMYLSRTGLLTFVDGWASITIGSGAGTHAITVLSDSAGPVFDPVVFTDPVTIQSPGGSIVLQSPNPYVTPAIYGGGNASITLSAGAILMDASVMTNGNAIAISGAVTLGGPTVVQIKSHGVNGTDLGSSGPAGGAITVNGAVNDDSAASILVIDAGYGGLRANVDLGASIGAVTPINGFAVAADELRLHGDIRVTGDLGVAGTNMGLGIVQVLANTMVLAGGADPLVPTTITIDTDASGGLKMGGMFDAPGVTITHLAGTGPVSLTIDTSANGGLAGSAIVLGDVGTGGALGGLALNAGTAGVLVGNVTLTGSFSSAGSTFVSTGAIVTGGGDVTISHSGAVTIGGAINAGAGDVSISGAGVTTAALAPITGGAVTAAGGSGNVLLGGAVTASGAFISTGAGFSNDGIITARGVSLTHTGAVAVNAALNATGFAVTIDGLSITIGGGAAVTGTTVTFSDVLGTAIHAPVTALTGFSATGGGIFSSFLLDTTASITTGGLPVIIDYTGTAATIHGPIAATGGDVTIKGALVGTGMLGSIGGGAIDVTSSAPLNLLAPVTGTGQVTLTAPGITTGPLATLSGGAVLLAGTGGNVTLVADVVSTGFFTSGGGAFTSDGAITAHLTTINHTGAVAVNADLDATGFAVTITGTSIAIAAGAPVTGTVVTLTDSLGVTINDDVIATAGFSSVGSGASTFTLAATGSISTTNGPVTIAHAGGLVQINGPIGAGTGTVAVTGLGFTTNGAGGSITGGTMTLDGGAGAVTIGCDVTADGPLTILGATFSNTGAISSKGLTIDLTGPLVISSPIHSAGFPVVLGGSTITVNAGADITGLTVKLTDVSGSTINAVVTGTNGVTSIGGGTFVLGTTGGLTSAGALLTVAHPGGFVTLGGPVHAGGGTVAIVGLGVTSTSGGTIGGGSVTLAGGAGNVTVGGAVTATGPFAVTGAAFSNSAAVTAHGITINLAGAVNIQSPLTAPGFAVTLGGSTINVGIAAPVTGGTVSLTDTSGISLLSVVTGANGIISTGGSTFTMGAAAGLAATNAPITVSHPTGLVTIGGVINSGAGAISISGKGVFPVNGSISGGAVTVAGGTGDVSLRDVTATGLFTSTGVNFNDGSPIVSNGALFFHSGLVAINGGINAGAGDLHVVGGGILATALGSLQGANITLTATAGNVNIDRIVSTPGALAVSGAQFLHGGPSITASGGVTLNMTGFVSLGGNVNAGTAPFVSVGGDFQNGGAISAGAVVLSHAGAVAISNVTAVGGGTVRIAAGNGATGGNITAGALVLTGGGTFQFATASHVGVLAATLNGPLSFANAGELTVGTVGEVAGITTQNSDLGISGGNLIVQGPLQAGSGAIFLNVNALQANAPMAAGSAFLTATTAAYTSSVTTTGILRIDGTTANIGGIVTAGGDLDVFSAATVSGAVTAGGNIMFSTSLVQTAGSIAAPARAITVGGPATLAATMTAGGNIAFLGALTQTAGSIVTTSGAISAGGPATVAAELTAPGAINFAQTLTQAGGAISSSGNAIAVNGAVTAAGSITAATDITFKSTFAGSGQVTAGATLSVADAASLAGTYRGTTVSMPGAITLTGDTTVVATGGGSAAGIMLGDITATGGLPDLTLQATLAALSPNGAKIAVGSMGANGVPLGDITFNTNGTVLLKRVVYGHSVTFASGTGGNLANVPDRATIISEGNLIVQVQDGFMMKQGQKLTVYDRAAQTGDTVTDGTLAIWSEEKGSLVQLGDVNAAGRIFVQAGTLAEPGRILLMNRPIGTTLAPDGTKQGPQDNGADIFALGLAVKTPGQLTFFGAGGSVVNTDLANMTTPMLFTGTLEIDNTALGPPGPSTRFRIGAINTEGADQTWFRGLRLTINQDVLFTNQGASAAPDGIPTLFTLGPVNGLVSPTVVRDIAVDGVTRVPQAASGSIIPRDVQTLQPERGQAISGALRDALRELGIYARDLRTDEIIEYLIGRALYDDVPYKLKVELSDNQVAANRLPFSPVLPTVDTYRKLFFKEVVAADGKPVMEDGKPKLEPQDEAIKTSFGQTWQRYRASLGETEEEPTAAKYRAYLEKNAGEDNACAAALANLSALHDLLTQIKSLGLTSNEFDVSRKVLLAKVRPLNMSLEALSEAVGGPAVAVANSTALK